ncbi:hypothetical protein ACFOEE_09655 [Pseudoalteromonas fenneropenaei]|uniref:HEAT repeat domain-containing protein n=1 Tax=Pseudoalteromonas fenneropenaei TaxID=1737459 RepID=A0ABV7CJQ5_9GAMM
MSKALGIAAVTLASVAIVISGYQQLNTSQPAPKPVTKLSMQAPNSAPASQVHDIAKTAATNEQQLEALQNYIANLEHRLNELEQIVLLNQPNHEEFSAKVLEVMETKQQQELEKMRTENPIFSFYQTLPEDYELKLKTDPDYAERVSKELRQKALNDSLSATERLAAIGQLQMTMFALNKSELEQYDYEVVDSVLKMTTRLSDDKLKIQAMEMLAHTPVTDQRLAHTFSTMLEKESNEYIRSLAADGLMSQYFQAGRNNPALRKQLAQEILALYENSGDSKVHGILQQQLGDEQFLEELRKNARN